MLSFVPVLGAIAALAAALWTLVTTVVALRAALDFGTGRAIATAVLAWLPSAILVSILLAAAGP